MPGTLVAYHSDPAHPRERAHGASVREGGRVPGGWHCQLQEMRGLGGGQRGRALIEEENAFSPRWPEGMLRQGARAPGPKGASRVGCGAERMAIG
jgi:hypothetical protein